MSARVQLVRLECVAVPDGEGERVALAAHPRRAHHHPDFEIRAPRGRATATCPCARPRPTSPQTPSRRQGRATVSCHYKSCAHDVTHLVSRGAGTGAARLAGTRAPSLNARARVPTAKQSRRQRVSTTALFPAGPLTWHEQKRTHRVATPQEMASRRVTGLLLI